MTPPKRKPNRLSAFDYNSVGAYFITICAKHRKPIFGQVVGGGVLDAPPNSKKARTAAGSGLFYCIFCCFVLLLS